VHSGRIIEVRVVVKLGQVKIRGWSALVVDPHFKTLGFNGSLQASGGPSMHIRITDSLIKCSMWSISMNLAAGKVSLMTCYAARWLFKSKF